MAGLKLFGQGKFEDALLEYAKALEQAPDSPEVLNAVAISQSKLGRHDEAIATIQRVIAITPEDPFAYTSLSIFLQRQGKIPEAESAGVLRIWEQIGRQSNQVTVHLPENSIGGTVELMDLRA